jgi:Holliday junction DNA helicase RuvA
MIQTISGVVTAQQESLLTVDVGTLGLGVSVPSSVHVTVGQPIALFAYMHWNQENGPSLFGFQTELDKTVFLLIISCSGIGPKIAMAILGQIGGPAFVQAVQDGNEKLLSSISGIGGKKAEQIIVHLKHKVTKLLKSGVQFEGAAQISEIHNVSEVLQSLNYSRREIDAAVDWLRDQQDGVQVPFDTLLRRALSFLSKKA